MAIISVGAIICLFLFAIISIIVKSPFSFPCFYHDFDVSGKRQPDLDEMIDKYINSGEFSKIQAHQKTIEEWMIRNKEIAEKSFLKSLRKNQYEECLKTNAYCFSMSRKQTRYKQQNYQKIAYQTNSVVETRCLTYEELQEKYEQLKAIGFEATLKEYHCKEQRKLMTKELRQQIMKRDNYTCQLCGKYMPDTVGLQIDHIIPVAKGGKSVPSNLQVLCSKCNGSKSDKMS